MIKRYAKIEKNVVVQIQPNKQKGFVEVGDNVFCGMIKDGEKFVIPKIEKDDAQLKNEKITELRVNLNNTDFKMLPDYDQPNDDVKVQRQKWRDELRALLDD